MKVSDIYKILDTFAPFESACSFDNCGLILGDMQDEVSAVYITLDADMYALSKAKEQGCSLVICHHPPIFHPLSKVISDNTAYHYIKSGISVIASHTCLDIAKGGVNDVLASAIGLSNVQEYMLDGAYLARVGDCDIYDGFEFAEHMKKALGSDRCDCVINRPVCKVMSVSGSGGSAVYDAYKAGCDTLVTGECKHDSFVLANDLSINLFALGHFETENIALKVLDNLLCDKVTTYVSDRAKLSIRR